jgi:glycosyltransferase involved in cell wall biosynthesis
MRVLMTADAVGGVWQYAELLTSLLVRAGHDVLVAVMGPSPDAQQRNALLAHGGVQLHSRSFALEWMRNPWRDVDAAGNWLLSLEAGFAPDVVHLNGYAHASLPWRAPTTVVAHSCVYSWWEAVHAEAPPFEWEEYRCRVRAGLTAASVVAAPTRAMADWLRRFYAVSRDVVVIPNACDASSWRAAPKEHFIFAAGRLWDPAKNLAALDAVATDLDWRVYIAGDATGPDGGVLELRAAQPLGRLAAQEIAAWMSRASIYALPARYEPFGLSVLEAALSGCGLVLSDIPSLRENWDGVARFVHPERPDELRGALRELTRDPATREAMGQAARRRGARFSPAAHLAAYDRLYREMVTTYGRTADSARAL